MPSLTIHMDRPFPAPVTTQTVNVPGTIDATGATDVSVALNNFIGTVSDGSIIAFPPNAIYQLGGTGYEVRHERDDCSPQPHLRGQRH